MTIGPLQLDQPLWLILIPITWALALLIARRSLAGLGRALRMTAIAMRLLLLALLALVLAEPSWRDKAENVAVITVVDTSRSMPEGARDAIIKYLSEAGRDAEPGDRLGVVTTANDAFARLLPTDRRAPSVVAEETDPGAWDLGARDATDLASGVRLALAMIPEDRAARIVVYSDGNETSGSLLSAAQSAAAAGVPIDVIPEAYDVTREVIFDRLVAPATARRGQPARLRFVLSARSPATGELSLLINDEPVDLSPDEEGISRRVELETGKNVVELPISLTRSGPQVYRAVFEPDDGSSDTIIQNNTAMGVTFVGGEGRTLLVTTDPAASGSLLGALEESRIETDMVGPEYLPPTLIELQTYDAVILHDVPSYAFSLAQQEQLAAYVHDSGGGLVMVGGPNSFGAGGWIGSPVAEVLPVQLDPPDKRQMPLGALALVIDRSGSMAAPVTGTGMTQQQIANEAAIIGVNSLSRLDQVAVISFSGSASVEVPLTRRGDGSQIERVIRGIGALGGTNMFPGIDLAFDELRKSPAGVKHIIVLSDGQTMGDPHAGIAKAQKLAEAGVTLSAVSIGDQSNDPLLAQLAHAAGGRFYAVKSQNSRAQLPKIFVKEAQTVRRALIWEGDPVTPVITDPSAEPLRGLTGGVPPLTGYVVTADREGLSQVTIRGPHEDPIAAMWQHGLGRVVAFTSDATSRWSASWIGWEGFRSFWEQHVRWVLRPSGSANLDVLTETRGEETRLIVTALNDAGEPVNFARFETRITRPGGESSRIDLRQTGPGRYEAGFPTDAPGAYLAALSYSMTSRESGETDRGFALAAVTRPFADEYRALKDNAALLAQAAELTGGRTLPSDPARAELFSRSGLTMPVALQPIWLPLALGALALFLADVATRRVRIDLGAIRAAVAALTRREQERGGEQIGALRAAREKARSRLAPEQAARKKQKFEAPADAPEPAATLDAPGRAAPIEYAAANPRSAPDEQTEAEDEEQGMSRLLRAKQRARQTLGSGNESDSP